MPVFNTKYILYGGKSINKKKKKLKGENNETRIILNVYIYIKYYHGFA